jgi:glycerol-3-phosphate acyltransferase PlsY
MSVLMSSVLIGLGYLLGSIPFGYLIVKERAGVDVRSVGSGNVGATNVLRVSGKGPAAAVLLMDMAKGCFPVLLGRLLGAPAPVVAAVAFAAVLGHVCPVFLGFRGGKGVATAVGAFLALAPIATAMSIVVFVILLVWKRYVSLGSVVAVATFPFWVYIYGRIGWMTVPWIAVCVAGTATALLVFLKHRANLRRIGEGTESRIGERLEVEKS